MLVKEYCAWEPSLLGLVLVGLGVFLLATGFGITTITIGIIVCRYFACYRLPACKCLDFPGLLCLLLALVTLFLIITGVLAILFAGEIIIGPILIGLGY